MCVYPSNELAPVYIQCVAISELYSNWLCISCRVVASYELAHRSCSYLQVRRTQAVRCMRMIRSFNSLLTFFSSPKDMSMLLQALFMIRLVCVGGSIESVGGSVSV